MTSDGPSLPDLLALAREAPAAQAAEAILIAKPAAESPAAITKLVRDMLKSGWDPHEAVDLAERFLQLFCADRQRLDAHAEACRKTAYNVAAEFWPAWQRPFARFDDATLDGALRIARKSLELADRLEAAPGVRANSEWLIGALSLARLNPADAKSYFAAAAQGFLSINDTLSTLLCEGFGYAVLLQSERSTEAADEMSRVIDSLERLGSGQARGFAAQLRCARDYVCEAP